MACADFAQQRHLGDAAVLLHRAAWMEVAAGRRVECAGDLAAHSRTISPRGNPGSQAFGVAWGEWVIGYAGGKNTSARTSMLSRGGASGASLLSNDVWNDSRARPSSALSWTRISTASSGCISEK